MKDKSINLESLLREDKDPGLIAQDILEGEFSELDIHRKDYLDRFLDFIYFKVSTGIPYIIHDAYPSKRMHDKDLESKIRELMNDHLYPDILFPLLKHFSRNMHNSDTNLYLANLVEADEIITTIYDTFVMFKNDSWILDPEKRTLNVKRIQQYLARSENQHSSPLDAACRFKYILEFIAIKQKVDHIYTMDQLKLSGDNEGLSSD
ncbi:MAG: hypothetical protein ACOCX9_03515 [Spirochaetota bacterium]